MKKVLLQVIRHFYVGNVKVAFKWNWELAHEQGGTL